MTYVDERIVELRFDNKQFEQETAKSMSTLDKLREKLSFKNASSGAEQLQKAVANINVNPILRGVDTIETKMSALGIAGKRVIENLVDWGMAGVDKIINKLQVPLNQIISGGKSRALNIEQAKFQLEGLGVAWADIQEDISYGVQDTAYGLDAAAKVASQLVASQVELGDDMKHALLGISGVAAMTNSTYEDIGHVYTTVAGNGRLMGEQLLQLSSRGINAAATLATALNTTEAEVRDMVSKGQISFQMFSDAMWQAFGEHAKSANKTFQGALSNTKAALSRLGADVAAQGFNSIRDILNDLIPKLKKFKNRMKPVEDSIISMVEAVGKLVQSFIKALDIKKIVDKISPVLKGAADAIGDFAAAYELVFNRRHSKTNDAAFFAEQRGLERLKETTKDVTSAMEHLYDISDDEKKIADEIWKEGKHGTGEARIKELGEHYDMVQAYIEKMIDLGWDEGKMNEFLADQQKQHTEEIEKTERAYKKQAFVENLVKIFDNLKHVAKNIGVSIKNILSVAFSALGDTISGKSVMDGFINLSARLAEISDKLLITKERAEKLRPIFEALFTVIKYIGKAVLNVAKAFSKMIDLIGKAIKYLKGNKTVKKIINSIKDAFISLKNAIVDLYERLKSSGVWQRFIDILQTIGKFLGKVIIGAFWAVGEAGETVIGVLGSGFEWVVEKIEAMIDAIRNGEDPISRFKAFFTENVLESSWLTKIKDVMAEIFGKDANGKSLFQRAYESARAFALGIVEGLSSVTINDLKKASVIVGIIGTTLGYLKWMWSIATLNKKLGSFVDGLSAFFVELKKTVKIYGRKANAEIFDMFASAVIKIVGSIIALMVAIAALDYLGFDTNSILVKATAIVIGVLTLYGVIQILVATLSKSTNVDHAITFAALKLPLIIFGISMLLKSLLTATAFFYGLYKEKDLDTRKLIIAIGTIVAFVGVMFLMIQSLSKSAENSTGLTGAMGMVFGISLMLYTMMKALKKVFKIVVQDEDAALRAFEIIGVLVGEIFIFMLGMAAIGKKGDIKIKGILGYLAGVTLLIRVGLLPLMNAVAELYLKGDDGIDALEEIQDMCMALLLFISIMSGITVALSKNADWAPIGAMAAVLIGMAAIFAALALAIKQLDKVSPDTLATFAILVDSITLIVSALAILVAVLSGVAGPAVIGALLAFAAVMASIGIALLGAGYGFKAFETGLKDFINALPGMLASLLIFFKQVKENKSELIDGLSELGATFFDGITQGLVSALLSLNADIPLLIAALNQTLITAMNAAAVSLVKNTPEMVSAFNNLTKALAYVLVYCSENALDWVKDPIKEYINDFANDLVDEVAEHVLDALDTVAGFFESWAVGAGFAHDGLTALRDDIQTLKKQTIDAHGGVGGSNKKLSEKYKIEAGKDAEIAYGSYRDAYEKWMHDNAGKDKSFLETVMESALENSSSIDQDKIKKSVGKYLGKFTGGVDISKYLESSLKSADIGSLNWEDLMSGDIDEINKKLGYNLSEGTVKEFVNGLDASWDANSPEFQEYLDNFQFEMDNWAENFDETGDTAIDNLYNGMDSKKDAITNVSKDIQEAAIKALYKYEPEFYVAGKYCAQGFADGFNDNEAQEKVFNNVAEMVLDARNKLAYTARISSPSKMFAELGAFCTAGFALGITQTEDEAEEASSTLGSVAMSALQSILDRIYDTTLSGMDTNPRITPILDLTELEEGLGYMNGLMTRNSSFGLAFGAANGYNANLAAKFAPKNQNDYDGSNIVDAVNSLRSDINGIKDTLGSIGFYVDGRQMATAIADPMHKELNDINVRTGRGVR